MADDVYITSSGTVESPIVITASGATGSQIYITTTASPVLSVNGYVGAVILTKGDIGLSNVENFSITGASGHLQSQIDNIGNSGFITGVDLSNYVRRSETGVFLTSGNLTNYYTNDNPSGFLTSSYLLNYVEKNETGVFATSLRLQNTGEHLSNQIASLSGDLIDSGVYLDNKINNASGDLQNQIDNIDYYPNSNPSGFVTGVDLSSYVLKSETGVFLSIYSLLIGDGSNTDILINHNFNTADLSISVYETGVSDQIVYPDIHISGSSGVVVSFLEAPSLYQYKCVIIG